MKGLLLALLLILIPLHADAEEQVWTLYDEAGKKITAICHEPAQGDEYVGGDNRLYEVVKVSGDAAVLREKGMIRLPDVSWIENEERAQPVSALGGKRISLYCTHSDESYEPSDGLYSDDQRGSIYEVAGRLAEELGGLGAEAEASDALHHPHDAGAYRRSRQTAVQLLKRAPDALLDIHRDGIPDPDEYAVTIGGSKASKIRLLVGRGNQNMEANKDFALTVKAVADKVYPGLIKDIYMGKGAFNQDLYPRALLLECGTYTLEKERVMTSMPMMADVLYRALYGGVTGAAGASDTRRAASGKAGGETKGEPDPSAVPAAESSKGGFSGVAAMVLVVALGLVVYGAASAGSFKGGMKKAGRNVSEMTGGLIGKKPEDEDK
ncbi:MAG: stage II sporulation protein P [Clostridia bacterium]|nr:stage II sporulation protein P [Clostridia bacterium]